MSKLWFRLLNGKKPVAVVEVLKQTDDPPESSVQRMAA